MTETFEKYMRESNLSANTIAAYLKAIRQYEALFGRVNRKNLQAYKLWLIEKYKPQTINQRLRAINCYLESIGKEICVVGRTSAKKWIFIFK